MKKLLFQEKELFLYLKSFIEKNNIKKLVIGFSGGLDSSILLFIIQKYFIKEYDILAIYINHNLSEDSLIWEKHCNNICKQYKINFKSYNLNINDLSKKDSIEKWARDKRYKIFEKHINSKREILLTAHHQDDQAETFLLQALRGSGILGLSSMPFFRDFSLGFLVRPLLNISKENLYKLAKFYNLSWVEDKSNKINIFTRNFLRNEVLSLLEKKYSNPKFNLAKSSNNCAEAQNLLNNYLDSDLKAISIKNKISIQDLSNLNSLKQKALLRRFLQKQNFLMPNKNQLEQWIKSIPNLLNKNYWSYKWDNNIIYKKDNYLIIDKYTEIYNFDYKNFYYKKTFNKNFKLNIKELDLILNFDDIKSFIENNYINQELEFSNYKGSLKIKINNINKELKKVCQEYNISQNNRKKIIIVYQDKNILAIYPYFIYKEKNFYNSTNI